MKEKVGKWKDDLHRTTCTGTTCARKAQDRRRCVSLSDSLFVCLLGCLFVCLFVFLLCFCFVFVFFFKR